jgi:predicted dehydrogenase
MSRNSFGDRYSVPHRFADWNAMLASGEVDAVHILLPPELHDRAIRDSLHHGVHVLVEKPMTVGSEQLDELLPLADERGLKLGVSHNFSFDPSYEKLRADLRCGILGRPDVITITWNRELTAWPR